MTKYFVLYDYIYSQFNTPTFVKMFDNEKEAIEFAKNKWSELTDTEKLKFNHAQLILAVFKYDITPSDNSDTDDKVWYHDVMWFTACEEDKPELVWISNEHMKSRLTYDYFNDYWEPQNLVNELMHPINDKALECFNIPSDEVIINDMENMLMEHPQNPDAVATLYRLHNHLYNTPMEFLQDFCKCFNLVLDCYS